MVHGNGKGKQQLFPLPELPAERDERGEEGRMGRLHAGQSREAQPRQKGEMAGVGRPPGLGADASDVAVTLHVLDHAGVKDGERLVVLAPDIGKGFVVRMKDRVGRVHEIPVAGCAVGVKPHTTFPDPVDGAAGDVEQGGIAPYAPGPQHRQQAADVEMDGDVAAGFDRRDVIVEMLAAGPCGAVEAVKAGLFHAPCFLLGLAGVQSFR